ncbi:hypothetical protein AAKU55_000244 [Oxalobacteraceae bacterium GrIS 1.11]
MKHFMARLLPLILALFGGIAYGQAQQAASADSDKQANPEPKRPGVAGGTWARVPADTATVADSAIEKELMGADVAKTATVKTKYSATRGRAKALIKADKSAKPAADKVPMK